MTITIYEYVKKESGLKDHEEIHILCSEVKDYMILHKIERLTRDVIRNTMDARTHDIKENNSMNDNKIETVDFTEGMNVKTIGELIESHRILKVFLNIEKNDYIEVLEDIEADQDRKDYFKQSISDHTVQLRKLEARIKLLDMVEGFRDYCTKGNGNTLTEADADALHDELECEECEETDTFIDDLFKVIFQSQIEKDKERAAWETKLIAEEKEHEENMKIIHKLLGL